MTDKKIKEILENIYADMPKDCVFSPIEKHAHMLVFKVGEMESRKETISEILGLLRNYRHWERAAGDVSPTAIVSVHFGRVADWLEAKLGESK